LAVFSWDSFADNHEAIDLGIPVYLLSRIKLRLLYAPIEIIADDIDKDENLDLIKHNDNNQK